ncbi:hypothetical protein [Parasynechococcus sp.]|uniref:hypothetical protein n=1 Tax=Parasynechococcus sp. TaxID=3101203 RepID=UPI003703D48D
MLGTNGAQKNLALTVLGCSANLIVCAVDSVAGSGIGWFQGSAVAVVHNVPVIAAIKIRTLMLLGCVTGAMHRGEWIVENLFV